MNARRVISDAAGSVLAALAGVPYFIFSFGKAWDAGPEPLYLVVWAGLSVLAVGAVILVLTLVLRPALLWLYPLMFSLVILVFGFASLQGEPFAGGFWFLLGLVTLAVGYGWARLSRWLSRKLAQPNSTPHTDARANSALHQPPSARAGERGR
jgi:hypothetical protein